jgi:hypothetical protein
MRKKNEHKKFRQVKKCMMERVGHPYLLTPCSEEMRQMKKAGSSREEFFTLWMATLHTWLEHIQQIAHIHLNKKLPFRRFRRWKRTV